MYLKKSISIKNLYKSYSKKAVLKNTSFELSQGSCEALMGKSGSGKTTLVSILMGLTKKNSGSISILDLPLEKNRKKLMLEVGFVPQDPLFDPEESVLQTLYASCAYWGISPKNSHERVHSIMKFFKMESYAKTLAKNLSGGNKKIVSLLKAVINEPKILILDEPTAGIDSFKKQLIWQYLQSYRLNNKSMLLISHNLNEISRLCTSCWILENGNVVTKKSLTEMLSTHSNKNYSVSISEPLNKKLSNKFPFAYKKLNPYQLTIQLNKEEKLTKLIASLADEGCSINTLEMIDYE